MSAADTLASIGPLRERATQSQSFDPAELRHGEVSVGAAIAAVAGLPLLVVIVVNLVMSLLILPRIDSSFLARCRWGGCRFCRQRLSGRW